VFFKAVSPHDLCAEHRPGLVHFAKSAGLVSFLFVRFEGVVLCGLEYLRRAYAVMEEVKSMTRLAQGA
jgi:hypothetical protein